MIFLPIYQTLCKMFYVNIFINPLQSHHEVIITVNFTDDKKKLRKVTQLVKGKGWVLVALSPPFLIGMSH